MDPSFSSQKIRSVSRAYYDKFGKEAYSKAPHRFVCGYHHGPMALVAKMEEALEAGQPVEDWMPFVAELQNGSLRPAAVA